MGRQPHVLVIPYPAQGHVMPLMKLSMKIAEHGVKVTFVITEFIESKIMASMPEKAWWSQIIRFVSIPDGLEGEDDRKDAAKTRETMLRVMPGHLKNLIDKVNQSNDCEQIKCVLADTSVGWVLEVAKKMGIPGTAVTPAGPGGMALSQHIPKLIEAGIIDTNGNPMSDELISLSSKETLAWKANELTWSCPSDPNIQKIIFEYASSTVQTYRNSNWVLCNSFNELDPWACDLVPNMLTIGPLLAKLKPDNNGIITRHELETKIKTLLIDDAIKANALKLKEMARNSLAQGGSSFLNFQTFIAQIFNY
ncbi:hypothetical protein QYF36_019749 [Acer negundo]|nr:hypothetical protein QYF36_019749 [Acer negundo]